MMSAVGKYCIHIFFSSVLSKDAVAAGNALFDTHRNSCEWIIGFRRAIL